MHFKLKIFILSIWGIGAINSASAQHFFSSGEYGVGLGASNYFGDLNQDFGFGYIRPSVSGFVRYHINPYLSIRGQALITQTGYDDKMSSNAYQQARNLSFRTNIGEVSAMTELNFFWFETGNTEKRFTPYIALGIGGFYYAPYTVLGGRTEPLRKLGTEGQKKNEYKERQYGSFNVCFPVGIGAKYWIAPGVNLAFELVNRFTTTDYLDDVSTTYVGEHNFPNNQTNPTPEQVLQDRSGNNLGTAGKQRGNSITKDQYFIAEFTLSFQLKTYKCPSHLKGLWVP